jgi:hypothetical protein
MFIVLDESGLPEAKGKLGTIDGGEACVMDLSEPL